MDDAFWARVNKDGPVSQVFGTPCWLWTGTLDKDGYGKYKRDHRAHRYAYQQVHGSCPPELDHGCHVRPCVRPDHLDGSEHQANTRNRRGAQMNSKTGVRGVRRHNSGFEVNVGRKYIGMFGSIELAEAAAIEARQRMFSTSQHQES